MTRAERQAEIARIRTEHRAILSTPLMSMGEISPAQVGMMSKSQRETWTRNGQTRLTLQARIHELNMSDAQLNANAEADAAKTAASMRLVLTCRISNLERVGIGKSGRMRPTYQKAINEAKAELSAL